MTDTNDYRVPNFWENFRLPQFSFAPGDFSPGNYFFPDFTFCYNQNFTPYFNIFDISFDYMNIPTLDLNSSIFGMPSLIPDYTFQPPQFLGSVVDTPPVTIQRKEPVATPVEDVPKITEPQETDAEQSKLKKADSGLNSSLYVAEEIAPGCYVHKMKYANIKDLKPSMKETLVKLSQKAQELGYTLVVSDGFRSHQQQIDLKRRKPKLAAKPGKSAHEYGVAVDLALVKNGKLVGDIKKSVPEFGRYAQSLGLEWGATWRSKYEPWHFNFQKWKEMADVRDEYKQWNRRA